MEPASGRGDPYTVPTRYWHARADGRIQCDLCPRGCRLREGQRGWCQVRERAGDQVVLTSYGRSSGWCVDPIEKKPLHHFLPGTAVLSFGTVGCNLACRFCQNWDLTASRGHEALSSVASPERLASMAQRLGCRSIAFTYNDPVTFLEYAVDAADACRDRGIRAVAVTAGYVAPRPRSDLFGHLDAVNVDLKGFSDDFYRKVTSGRLAVVLDTLEYLATTSLWTEVTTLLIPGYNDSDGEIAAECAWLVEHLGPDVPLHFTAFRPSHRMRGVPPTPLGTLRRASALARQHGLRHVYLGNVPDREGRTTCCSACGESVIERDGYRIGRYALDLGGRCCCGAALPGRFDGPVGDWDGRCLRVPPAQFTPPP